MFKKIFIGFLFLILWFVYDLCVERSFLMQIKLSSDGHYAISTHHGGYLMLWDLEKKTRKTIGTYPNIYSLQFIAGTHNFLWQKVKDNEVIVQNVEGKVIKTFNPGFPVYGHVMKKDLETYIASDKDWSLYYLDKEKIKMFQKDHSGYIETMKLLTMQLTEHYLYTSGDGKDVGEKFPISIGHNRRDFKPSLPERLNDSLFRGQTLWDLKTRKPIKKFIGNVFKTDGVISADEKTVVAGDENSFLYSWDVDSGIRRRIDEPANPDFQCGIDEECWQALRKQLREDVPRPKDFYKPNHIHSTSNLAVRFIDDKHFLRFVMEVNYAILYSVDSPKILAYIDLGQNPKPQSFYHADANMIDTAPKAKTLVMGQSFMEDDIPIGKGTGIIVYKYDDEKKQLQRVWTPDGPSWHMNWNNLLDLLTTVFLDRSKFG